MTQPSKPLHVRLAGPDLIGHPLYNKGTAFTAEERVAFDLDGLLPPHVETLEDQKARAWKALIGKSTAIGKHIYLRQLQDTDETLFYALALDHLSEIMPLIYTPTVGEACQRFSEIYRRARGLFIPFSMKDRIGEILDNAQNRHVEVIVVTDGERILGLGDQGAGGMGIPIGKLSLYTACGGIDPARTLPIMLDIGTNNEDLLKDPMYLGWRHERIGEDDYYAFVDAFVEAVKNRFPDVLLQWEDFAQRHAAPLLAKYRDQLCTFNDDIQGTAAVAYGTLLSAVKVAGSDITKQVVVMFGAGSAGCGIAEQICAGMVRNGLDEKEARARIHMIDRPGLLHDGLDNLLDIQRPLAQPKDRVAGWASMENGTITLADTIRHAGATVLIGVSGQPGSFDEAIITAMAENTERPIVFPLSNPTSRCEALPADIIRWTGGRALVGTGSPFDPVPWDGQKIAIAQSNNSYIFPGLGLGILAGGATRVTDAMMMAAAEALAALAPAMTDPAGALLPALDDSRAVSRAIAIAVAREAQIEGVAPAMDETATEAAVDARMWQPVYRPLVRERA